MGLPSLGTAAAALAGIWAAYNGLLYAADPTRRYRAESAWFVFFALLLVTAISAIARAPHPAPRSTSITTRTLIVGMLAFVIGAVALYAPMVSIGLLSDDFILLARARSGALVDPAWEFLRPLPLALWRIAGAPISLHALNIVLHGVNAWLTATLAVRVGLPPIAALLAGLIFLTFPTSVEAVAWNAGIFDVLLVTPVLSACLAATSMANSARRTAAIAALTAAALATKETAVITPALIFIASSMWRWDRMRQAALPAAISASVVALYVVIRIAAGFTSAPPSQGVSGYMLKEFVSRPYATLGLPFHLELLTSHRWIRTVFALLWPLLFVMSASQWRTDRLTTIRVLGCAAWILVSVLPVATMLFIADDLQGSRYLYLGSAAFSIMLLALVANMDQTVQLLIAISLVALFAVSTRLHQSTWIAAADERDRVLAAFRNANFDCSPGEVRGLPDHVQGAYVFRNGFAEAVRSITPPRQTPCALQWDGKRFTVVR